MPFDLRLTKINPNMTTAAVECSYCEAGTQIKAGAKLFDLRVDLSAGFSQYCPPISYFRIVSRENVWVRKLLVKPGDSINIGDMLAEFSAELDGPVDEVPARPLRVTTAGIAHHAAMWSERET